MARKIAALPVHQTWPMAPETLLLEFKGSGSGFRFSRFQGWGFLQHHLQSRGQGVFSLLMELEKDSAGLQQFRGKRAWLRVYV